MRKVMIALAGMVVLAVVLYFTGFMGGFAEGFVSSREAVREGHAGLPTCESSQGQAGAKQASNDAPLAKQNGIAVILMSDVKKVSISADKVECSATATRDGNPQHFIVEGERGIGKSSLCLWVDYLAKGDITYDGQHRLSFVVVNIELHGAMAYDDIVDAVLAELKRQISTRQALLETCKKAWDFLSRFQISGLKYERPQSLSTNSQRLDELTDVLVNLIEESAGAVEGVLILIDEADRPTSDAHLGQLCKLLTERLSRRRCEKVCVGLSGLPDLLYKLKESHESSLRIFNILELKPLEFAEPNREEVPWWFHHSPP